MARFVKAPTARATISSTMTGLEISIPSRRSWFVVIFLTMWLTFWTIGGLDAAQELISNPRQGEERWFLLVWLTFWTAGEVFALIILLWNVAGREVARFEPTHIEIRRGVAGVGLSKHYDIGEASNLRLAPSSFNMFDPRQTFMLWGLGGGLLAFDYGASTVRFAAGIEEAEGAVLVRAIHERVSRLKQVSA